MYYINFRVPNVAVKSLCCFFETERGLAEAHRGLATCKEIDLRAALRVARATAKAEKFIPKLTSLQLQQLRVQVSAYARGATL